MGTYIFIALIINTMVVTGFWLYYLCKSDRQDEDHRVSKDAEAISEILGKCLTVERATTPQVAKLKPQATTKSESESSEKKDSMFADGNGTDTDREEKKTVAQIRSEEMDEAFDNKNPISTESIEVAYGNEQSQVDLDDELEFITSNTKVQVEFATGALMEDINAAVKTSSEERAPHQELVKAGRTFIQLEGNDFYNQIVNNSDDRARRISEMMSMALKEVDVKIKKTKHKTIVGIENFNLSDYV